MYVLIRGQLVAGQIADMHDSTQSAAGISFKSQFLYLAVYITRYLDLLWTFYLPSSLYNTTFKILFIGSSIYVVYLTSGGGVKMHTELSWGEFTHETCPTVPHDTIPYPALSCPALPCPALP